MCLGTFAGLRYGYRQTGNRTALAVEIKFAEWAEKILAGLSDAQLQQMLNTEFGGMPEVAADLYADTGDRRWLALSHKFDRAVRNSSRSHAARIGWGDCMATRRCRSCSVRGPLCVYTGIADDLAGRHLLLGFRRRPPYVRHGRPRQDEYFREPDKLSNIVDGRTAETCNVYNMLKLTRLLFALKPDVKYAEFEERALFNHILGSIDAADGAMCYMVPVGHGVRREYAGHVAQFHLLCRVRDGKPCPARRRHLP